jgi:integral membrane protein
VNEVKTFRLVALAEATSFLLLLVATFVKYQAENEIGVKVLGPVHGALFLFYCALALVVRPVLGWSFWRTIAVLAGAVLPFGGFIVDRKVLAQRTTV